MNLLHFLLVRTAGVEPARGLPLRILSPVCLPVPPRPKSAGDGARNPGLTKRHPCPRNTSARVAKRYPRVTANLDNSNRANRQKLTWRGTAVWCRTIPWLGRGTMANRLQARRLCHRLGDMATASNAGRCLRRLRGRLKMLGTTCIQCGVIVALMFIGGAREQLAEAKKLLREWEPKLPELSAGWCDQQQTFAGADLGNSQRSEAVA